MEVRACNKCRKLFHYIYGPDDLCPECRHTISEIGEELKPEMNAILKPMNSDDEERYKRVKDYIMLHPKATIAQISEENGVTVSKLYEWIREDRLEFSDDSKFAWFECEVCGAKIKSGTLCYRCKSKRSK